MSTALVSTSPAAPERAEPIKINRDRLDSVDLVRGIVMVIMALDHVRDFWYRWAFVDPTNINVTTPELFFTRWITHYCAPTFIFLAGTGAFLSRSRGKSKVQLSWFLFSRGLWLAFYELVINRIAWGFSFDYHMHTPGVFWAIGMSMVVLSVLVYFPTMVVTVFGLGMILIHNSYDGWTAAQVGLPDQLWTPLHNDFDTVYWVFSPGDEIHFHTGYLLIPWMGVMAAGYGFGSLLVLDRATRRKNVLCLGLLLIVSFFLLRYANVYGDAPTRQPGTAGPWSRQPTTIYTIISFLNCQKYPPSLCYLLMTLGPSITLIGLFDRPLGPIVKPILTFGRVPMFFYFLHIPLIHGGAVLFDLVRYGESPLGINGPGVSQATIDKWPTYGVPLIGVYAVWIAVVVILYFPCRWYAGLKKRHPGGILSYM